MENGVCDVNMPIRETAEVSKLASEAVSGGHLNQIRVAEFKKMVNKAVTGVTMSSRLHSNPVYTTALDTCTGLSAQSSEVNMILFRDTAANDSADFFQLGQWPVRFSIRIMQMNEGSFTGGVLKRRQCLGIAFFNRLLALDNFTLIQIKHVIKQDTVSANLGFCITRFFAEFEAELQSRNKRNAQTKQPPVLGISKNRCTEKQLQERTQLITSVIINTRHFFEVIGIGYVKRDIFLGWLFVHYFKSLFFILPLRLLLLLLRFRGYRAMSTMKFITVV
ncbi:hypothetical protein XNC3_1640029 [Xenorhabdus nematophila F1]|nr:hypothetical protein XNC3_1640029 [Xenorhabdus nematophila F1]